MSSANSSLSEAFSLTSDGVLDGDRLLVGSGARSDSSSLSEMVMIVMRRCFLACLFVDTRCGVRGAKLRPQLDSALFASLNLELCVQ